LGVIPGKVFADYDALYRKHRDQFYAPQEARALAAPDFAMRATKEEYTLLIRRNGADKVTVVEFELQGGKYRVRSAYTTRPVSDEMEGGCPALGRDSQGTGANR